MEYTKSYEWKQISLHASIHAGRPVTMNEMRTNNILHGLDCPQTNLATLTRHEQSVWEEKVCPHPVLVPKNLTKELEQFHQALALAITSIMERWGGLSDGSKSLAALMPLHPQEKDLIHVGYSFPFSRRKLMPGYSGCIKSPRKATCHYSGLVQGIGGPTSFSPYTRSWACRFISAKSTPVLSP